MLLTMKLRLTIIALLLSLSAAAQNIKVTAERQADKSVVFRVEKLGYGRYTIVFQFKELENCNFVPSDSYLIRNSTDLIHLRPTSDKAEIGYRYSWHSWVGDLLTAPDTTFVYRFPKSEHNRSEATECYDIYKAMFGQATSENFVSYYFPSSQGDTVFVARKGEVVRVKREHVAPKQGIAYTSDRVDVTIEHDDGTRALYSMLDPDNIFVEEGMVVTPDRPIGLVGTFNNDRFGFYFSVMYKVWKVKGEKTINHYFPPLFQTDRGVVRLQHGEEYRAVVDDELVEREMSSREKRRRKRQ